MSCDEPTSSVSSSSGLTRSSTSSSIRATKRKLEDAIHSLDDAVGSTESLVQPPPAKKLHTVRSIYSTLAKYGIKPKETKDSNADKQDPLTKNTPHLAAILARTASRTRKVLPFKLPGTPTSNSPPIPSTSEYRPSSTPSFLARLATFKLSTYANKPTAIDAVAASKCGWINDGKDRLVCGICNVSWVVVGTDRMSRDAANTLIEKQRVSLVDMHKDGCPWKARQCDASIYRIPLQSPAAMARDIKANAMVLDSVLSGVETKHPLSSNQVRGLRNALASVSVPTTTPSEGEPPRTPTHGSTSPPSSPTPSPPHEPSEAAILTSLFGWALAPVPPKRTQIPSLSRASSVIHSVPQTPSIRRSPSLASPHTALRNGTSTPSTPRPSLRFGSPFPSNSESAKRDSSLLHCTLCQRRIGLWAFAPPVQPPDFVSTATPTNGSAQQRPPPHQRQFDLLKEHRSYCPYVVRSTVVPTLPVPPTHGRNNSSLTQVNNLGNGGALEGWRAVLAVVLRSGMGQRQRMGVLHNFGEHLSTEGTTEDMDGVEAMVAGVKSRGGKELLKYVKGLLG